MPVAPQSCSSRSRPGEHVSSNADKAPAAPDRPPLPPAAIETPAGPMIGRTTGQPVVMTFTETDMSQHDIAVFLGPQQQWLLRGPRGPLIPIGNQESQFRSSGESHQTCRRSSCLLPKRFFKAFRPLSRPTGEPSWHGSGSLVSIEWRSSPARLITSIVAGRHEPAWRRSLAVACSSWLLCVG